MIDPFKQLGIILVTDQSQSVSISEPRPKFIFLPPSEILKARLNLRQRLCKCSSLPRKQAPSSVIRDISLTSTGLPRSIEVVSGSRVEFRNSEIGETLVSSQTLLPIAFSTVPFFCLVGCLSYAYILPPRRSRGSTALVTARASVQHEDEHQLSSRMKLSISTAQLSSARSTSALGPAGCKPPDFSSAAFSKNTKVFSLFPAWANQTIGISQS